MTNQKYRIIYSAYQFPVLDIIHTHLQKELDAEMVYALTDTKYEHDFRQKYPDAVFHSIFKSRKGLCAEEMTEIELSGCNDKLLSHMGNYKEMALDIMGREDKDGWNFSYMERKWHFLWLIRYWSNIVKKLKPTMLISRNIPHFASEYVLFRVCEYYGIPCLSVENIAPLGRSYIIKGIDNRSKAIIDAQEHCPETKPSKLVEEFVTKVQGERQKAIPDYIIKKIEKRKNESKIRYRVIRLVKDIGAVIIKGPKSPVYTNIKISKLPIYDSRTWMNEWQYRLYLWHTRSKITGLEELYRQYIEPVDIEKPYVFFAPNYQPERTTLPDAGEFGDMLFLVDTISSCVPEGWTVYYKEHPTIFYKPGATNFRGHLYRGKEFYDRVSKYKNVKLIDHTLDTFDLIDNARAVLTATGTAAYEASIRGVPAIIFGEFWASGCNGLYKVSNRSELKKAFEKIEGGYRPSIQTWLSYIQAAEQISFKSVKTLIEMHDGSSKALLDKEIIRLADEYIRFIKASKT